MRALKKNMKDQILTNDRKILHCPIWLSIQEMQETIGTILMTMSSFVRNVEFRWNSLKK